MGTTVREKLIRSNRRTRSARPDSDHPATLTTNGNVEKSANTTSDVKPQNHQTAIETFDPNLDSCTSPNLNPDSHCVIDDSGWGYCTEEQLEEILLKNLDFLYNDTVNKLVTLGYDEEVALKGVLRNGHCYGGMDVLTNILHNSLTYLSSGGASEGNVEESDTASFLNLRQMEEYSLAGMVCLLQQVKPHLSKGDAMWCLLMSDLHVGRASMMEIPISSSTNENGCEISLRSGSGGPGVNDSNGGPVGVTPALCRFHGGWGFGNGGTSQYPMNGVIPYASELALQKDIECPKRFNLSPSMKSLLKRNVAMFAAGFRANSKQFHSQSQACPSSLSSGDSSGGYGSVAEVSGHNVESLCEKNRDAVNSVLSKFRNLNLEETAEHVPIDQKDEMTLRLIHQIKDMEKQVKERKEWAHQKAMQAARKLTHDLTELKTLRMEREETQRLKKGKQALEDSTMKRFSEMENALRKASGQVDRANAAVRKLETENAEIRAELEASKLSASESVAACLEIAKREKRSFKKILTWEKRKTKMQEDIAAEKQKILELQQQLALVESATREYGEKRKQEQNAKELALTQLEEARRLKEDAESNNKRKLKTLRLKIEIDFRRYKDDLQRLEQEYARLKESAQSTDADLNSDDTWTDKTNGMNPQGETIASLLQELDQLEEGSPEKEVSCDRECMICLKDEVSVVFLPCAHQVICANCNENYGKKGKSICPYCRVPIDQRVRVYGASS